MNLEADAFFENVAKLEYLRITKTNKKYIHNRTKDTVCSFLGSCTM
jgi:hypothetical protein